MERAHAAGADESNSLRGVHRPSMSEADAFAIDVGFALVTATRVHFAVDHSPTVVGLDALVVVRRRARLALAQQRDDAEAQLGALGRRVHVDVRHHVGARMRGFVLHEVHDVVDAGADSRADAGQVEHAVLGEDRAQLIPVAIVDRVAIAARNFVECEPVFGTLLAPRLAGKRATVDNLGMAGHVARLVARQPDSGVRDVDGDADPAEHLGLAEGVERCRVHAIAIASGATGTVREHVTEVSVAR
ncbi:hypothetical protein GQR58_029737 [Nymphon striatum]|nr:hypothetical protein GQR58_029737 [Nymphon striatum]